MKYKKEYAKIALENFKSGYNCCQSVLLAFKDELGMDEEQLAKLASGFGAGMGKLREVCGAVSGMFMVASLLKGYSSPKAKEEKVETYALIHSMADEFKAQCGSIICRELINQSDNGNVVPEERTETYYKKRPCGELCAIAAEIVAQKLF